MSDFKAIATVTIVLRNLLTEVVDDLKDVLAGVGISTKPPYATGNLSPNRLNIFLYQISYNNAFENMDKPTRNFNGHIIKTPQLGIDLNYLLTVFSENNDELKGQLILASAMRIINENPVLTKREIQSIVDSNSEPLIVQSDLAEQIE